MTFKDITGQRFGNLVAIRRVNVHGRAIWLCRCDCGTEKEIYGTDIRMGRTVACGCRRGGPIHRKAKTPEHSAWVSMIARCERPTHPAFKNYGGRGIKVCKRWRESFETFLADMGRKPSAGLTLDRIDNDGNYD